VRRKGEGATGAFSFLRLSQVAGLRRCGRDYCNTRLTISLWHMIVGSDSMGRRLVGLALLLAAMLALASCGAAASPRPSASASESSGVYGITLVNRGGRMTAAPTPSPLPGGFVTSVLVPYPQGVVLIKAARGQDAGQLIARVRSDAQGLFRIALPSGPYPVTGNVQITVHVTVRAGGYSRVRIQVAVRH
jgi:hypothetical protein